MMNSPNSTTQPPSLRGAAAPRPLFQHTTTACHPEPGRCKTGPPRSTVSRAWGISANGGEGSASGFCVGAAGIMSAWPAKLDYRVTRSKQITSHFLIDNFCTHLRRHASKSTIVRSADYCHSPARRSLGEGGSLACPPQQLPAEADRASSLKPLASRANRQYEILEPHVSHRKQRVGDFLIAKFRPIIRQLEHLVPNAVCSRLSTVDSRLLSNRPKSTVCKFAVLRALFPNSQLSTLDSQLRASHV